MKKILPIIILFLLGACVAPLTANQAWQLDDLRLLDPSDTPDPATDITAIYLRQTQEDWQLRIDLLDVDFNQPYELIIYLWDNNSFSDAPLAISISWDAAATILDTGVCTGSVHPRVVRDYELDTIVVSIRRADIGSEPRFDVLTSLPEASLPIDEARGIMHNNTPPESHARLLMAFYDTFQSATPALALRSWNGAHTGPRGERHGLYYLLDAGESYQIPLLLLDLQTPENLSTLEAIGAMEPLERMAAKHLVGYPQSLFDPATLFHEEIIAEFEPTTTGPSLSLRRTLASAALTENAAPIIVGGRLSQSTWASPDYVYPTLAYIAARPYIQPMSAKEISHTYGQELTNKLAWPKTNQPPIEMVKADIVHVLSQPAHASQQTALQATYREQLLPPLEKAATWAEAPESLLECSDETCLWANIRFFAVFKLDGARLEFLFFNDGKNIHQIIGPTAQFMVSMSDPATWDLSLGELADTGQIMGAFADEDNTSYPAYEPRHVENGIAFERKDGQRVKIFVFDENSLLVTYESAPVTINIPLVIDPWERFHAGWATSYQLDGTTWGLAHGLMVSIQADGPVALRGFNESLVLLDQPEDPDLGYPAGHFVPFPTAIAKIVHTPGDNPIQLIIDVGE